MTDWKALADERGVLLLEQSLRIEELEAVARLSRDLLVELDTYWSGVSGPSLSGIMLDWRNKYRILLEDSGAAQARPEDE